MVGCEPVDLGKTYRLCTKAYLADGKDGYSCLAGSPVIVNEDDGPQLSTIIQNHFQSVSYLTGQCKFKYYHHQSIISRSQRKSLSRQTTIVEEDESGSYADRNELRAAQVDEPDVRRRWKKVQIAVTFARRLAVDEAESKEVQVALAPKVQQRIRILDSSLENKF